MRNPTLGRGLRAQEGVAEDGDHRARDQQVLLDLRVGAPGGVRTPGKDVAKWQYREPEKGKA